MDIFFYIIIFIIGTVFGSFFTLAVYRIPLKKDITHERSFCPNCNHKLGFWDMIYGHALAQSPKPKQPYVQLLSPPKS